MDKDVELIAITVGGNTLAGIPSSVTAEDSEPGVRASPLNTNTYIQICGYAIIIIMRQ